MSLPSKASNRSCSVGWALFLSRAYIDITKPGVQKPHWEPLCIARRSWNKIDLHPVHLYSSRARLETLWVMEWIYLKTRVWLFSFVSWVLNWIEYLVTFIIVENYTDTFQKEVAKFQFVSYITSIRVWQTIGTSSKPHCVNNIEEEYILKRMLQISNKI